MARRGQIGPAGTVEGNAYYQSIDETTPHG